jgi:hypothetical protein
MIEPLPDFPGQQHASVSNASWQMEFTIWQLAR